MYLWEIVAHKMMKFYGLSFYSYYFSVTAVTGVVAAEISPWLNFIRKVCTYYKEVNHLCQKIEEDADVDSDLVEITAAGL